MREYQNPPDQSLQEAIPRADYTHRGLNPDWPRSPRLLCNPIRHQHPLNALLTRKVLPTLLRPYTATNSGLSELANSVSLAISFSLPIILSIFGDLLMFTLRVQRYQFPSKPHSQPCENIIILTDFHQIHPQNLSPANCTFRPSTVAKIISMSFQKL